MAIDADLRSLMKDTVTITTGQTVNNYGEKSGGSSTAYTARYVKKLEWIRDIQGEMRKAFGIVYLDRVTGVTPNDKITLPDSTTPPILRVDTFPDDSGSYYEQVYLGYV